MRITDEDPPKVYFDDKEQVEWGEVARRRQAAAIDYLVGNGLATRAKALADNPLRLALAGAWVAATRARMATMSA